MNQYFSIINRRTLYTLIISLAVPFIAYKEGIKHNIDLTLISIAIIFPLVFAIRGAFRRREKALEHLSRFRGALKIIGNCFATNSKLSDAKKKEIHGVLSEISENLIKYLKSKNMSIQEVDKSIDKVEQFVLDNDDTISGGFRLKIFSFMRSVNEGIENLEAIHTHRTPISLKAYCKVFIYIFPLIYTPTIIEKIGDAPDSQYITYFVVIVSEFILISLYNIQDDMEYPFDNEGLDDIKLDNFKFDR
jgi:predicted membrane chloride channel (bestrophin family)